MSPPSFTPETLAKAQAARAASQGALRATRERFGPVTEVYKDSPPGVGWVLVHRGHKEYYLTRARCVERLEELQADEAETAETLPDGTRIIRGVRGWEVHTPQGGQKWYFDTKARAVRALGRAQRPL